MRRGALVLALVLAGRGAAGAEPAGLATFGAGGIQVDGAALFAGEVIGAAFDPDQELIWFRSGTTLQVIDLRAKQRKPVVVLKKLPAGDVVISGWSEARVGDPTEGIMRRADAYIELELTKKPKVYAVFEERGYAEGIRVERTRDKRVKVAGASWLKKQRKRRPRARSAAGGSPHIGKVTIDRSWPCPPAPACTGCLDESEEAESAAWWEQNCHDTAIGEATELGATGLERVVIWEHELDGPSCAVRDPATGRFAALGGGPFGATADVAACTAMPHPTEKAWLYAGAVCRADDQEVVCASPAAGPGFAWIVR